MLVQSRRLTLWIAASNPYMVAAALVITHVVLLSFLYISLAIALLMIIDVVPGFVYWMAYAEIGIPRGYTVAVKEVSPHRWAFRASKGDEVFVDKISTSVGKYNKIYDTWHSRSAALREARSACQKHKQKINAEARVASDVLEVVGKDAKRELERDKMMRQAKRIQQLEHELELVR